MGASCAGSLSDGRRTGDDGGMMPPARGLGSPPEVGGLRDAGTAGGGGPALAPDAGGVAVEVEPALPPDPAASPAVGNFKAAARARTAADAAGLDRGAGVGTERVTPPVCGGLPAGAAGEEATVPGEPTRGSRAGVRAGGAPDVGTPDPARPPPWGGFGGGPDDMRQRLGYTTIPACGTSRKPSYFPARERTSTAGGFAKSSHRRSSSFLSGWPSSTTNRYLNLRGLPGSIVIDPFLLGARPMTTVEVSPEWKRSSTTAGR